MGLSPQKPAAAPKPPPPPQPAAPSAAAAAAAAASSLYGSAGLMDPATSAYYAALYRSGPLLNCFLFPFCENSLIALDGKSMTPHRGNTILFRSSQQLPRLRL